MTERKHGHYFKDVSDLDEADVYEMCEVFEVNDHSGCIHHAIKKLLLPGDRGGGKSTAIDIKEAIDSLQRKLEIMTRVERRKKQRELRLHVKEHNAGVLRQVESKERVRVTKPDRTGPGNREAPPDHVFS